MNRFLTHLAVKARRGRVDSESGSGGVAVSIPARAGTTAEPNGRGGAGAQAEAAAGGADAGRSGSGPEREGEAQLVCALLYGSGLRIQEGLRLRVKDLEFSRGEITVRNGKGDVDRVTMLPETVYEALQEHLRRVGEQHQADLRVGRGRAPLPHALARKYPNADRDWGWQWVFPASKHYVDRKTGIEHRHHLHESVVEKAVHEAVRRAKVVKPASPHTFRHSFRRTCSREPRRAGSAKPAGPAAEGRGE